MAHVTNIRAVIHTEYATITKNFSSVKEYILHVVYLQRMGYNIISHGYVVLPKEH